MDYEKAYKDALAKARHYYLTGKGESVDFIKMIFPEFAESEDERMRNVAINACKYMVENFENSTKQYEDAITWLEEQSDIGEDLIAKKYLINKGYPIDTNGTFPTYEEMYNIIREGLEKQGLQKPIDKVEPRFKVGDWIVENGVNRNPVQITSFEEDKGSGIKVWFNNGTGTYIEFFKDYHKWTIQDAKDGDVLFQNLMCGKTFIYNGVNSDMAILYSFIVSNDGKDVLPYHIGKPNTGIGYIEENKNIIHPATKEQRDLLFQKMIETGYEWDAEKKELRKIKQEPIWEWDANTKELKKIEQKPSWSEDDECIYQSIIDDTVQENQLDSKQIAWLKSLKQRIEE